VVTFGTLVAVYPPSGSVMVHGTDSFQVPGAPSLPLIDKDKRTELRFMCVLLWDAASCKGRQ
jgi:hypothetical protein